MTLSLAISILLEETKKTPARACCQILIVGGWQNVPFEWNAAVRLAEISGAAVRMLGGDGSVIRTHPAKVA